ncbi:hypothetical protein SESBI_25279 [Sesbania bispinosa]|nr:hypothetical protein SESBI_25279 [Sesbania bispinosa]
MGLQPPHANLSDVDKGVSPREFCRFNNLFGGLISESDSRLGAFRLENFGGLIGEVITWGQRCGHLKAILEVFPEGNFGDLNDGSYLLKLFEEQHNENQGGFINNSGANTHEAAMGRFDANFVGNNNGNNLNFGLPTHGNFASRGEFGSDSQVPTSFGGKFP